MGSNGLEPIQTIVIPTEKNLTKVTKNSHFYCAMPMGGLVMNIKDASHSDFHRPGGPVVI